MFRKNLLPLTRRCRRTVKLRDFKITNFTRKTPIPPMKSKITYLLLAAFAVSLTAKAQTPYWQIPDSLSWGKELPRGEVVCYASQDESVEKSYHKSTYLQPIENWTSQSTPDAVIYTSTYKLPFSWIERQIFLHIGRTSGAFTVSVNGRTAGYSQTGSTPSEFNLTSYSQEGNNSVSITIYRNSVSQHLENGRKPSEPRIEGETYILAQPKVRVRDIFIDTRMQGTDGLLSLGVILKSQMLNPKDYRVYYQLLSPRGEVVSQEYKDVTLDMRKEDTVRFFDNIKDIMPWSHEEPCLYTLLIKTQNEGRFREYLSFQVGFRGIETREGIIYLNGVQLRVAMQPYTPSRDMSAVRKDIEELRQKGFNTLKISGGPQSREFYALCDSMGMYVCNQADINTSFGGESRKIGGNISNNPHWADTFRERVMSMYHGSKNSPSVIMFSLAENSANGYNLYESYMALKKTEHDRPVIYPEGGEWNNDTLNMTRMSSIRRTASANWALITARNAEKGEFTIHNTRHYTPIIGELRCRIAVKNKFVSTTSIPLRVLPKSSTDVTVPIQNVKAGEEYVVILEVVTRAPVNRYTLPKTETEEQYSDMIRHKDEKNAAKNGTGTDETVLALKGFKGKAAE